MTMKYKKSVKTIVGVLAGNTVLAFVVAAFILPHGLVMGGATGIGIAISKFVQLDLSIIIFVLNILLFTLGAIIFGKHFALTTLVSTIYYPIALRVIRSIHGINTFTDDPLLGAVFAGLLLGLGIGIVMRVGSSTGGTDILALVFHKWFHSPVAICMYAVDFVIIAVQALFATKEQILYGILALLLTSIVIGRVTIFGQAQIQLFVISEKFEEIREQLLKEMQVGATMVLIETGLEAQNAKGILCVIPNRKLYSVKEKIQKTDDKAFITISQINEVRGRGFTLDRNYK